LVQAVSASAGAQVGGTSTAQAQANIGGAAQAFVTSGQAVGFETGAPVSSSTAPVLAGNSNIASAFGSSPVFFAMGELGGGYSTGGTIAQTTTVSLNETVDLTKLSTRGELVVGLFDGKVVGTGVESVTFTLVADGDTVINQTFSSAAQALAYFSNDGIGSLGSLASGGTLGANTLTLKATLTVTTLGAGSGFYGGLIIGDPPASKPALTMPAASAGGFAQAMAGLGANSGAGHALPTHDGHGAQPTMLAVNRLTQPA
jgi:hypothetical protein